MRPLASHTLVAVVALGAVCLLPTCDDTRAVEDDPPLDSEVDDGATDGSSDAADRADDTDSAVQSSLRAGLDSKRDT